VYATIGSHLSVILQEMDTFGKLAHTVVVQINRVSPRSILFAGVLLRIILIGVAAIQDTLSEVAYTDVDYQVFTDAATNVYRGLSPYDQTTDLLAADLTKYRYTPILSWLLVPNVWFPAFGKVLFSLFDIVGAYLLLTLIARRRDKDDKHHSLNEKIAVTMFLFNPWTVAISTRGSGESIVLVAILLMLWCFERRYDVLGGLCLGFLVHWRLVPAIFMCPIFAHFGVFTYRTARIGCSAISLFFLLGYACYIIYGFVFIDEAYLYHLRRVDAKHNFSIAFLPSQYSSEDFLSWLLVKGLSIAQLAAIVVMGLLPQTMERAVLRQFLALVTFNKVITAQYFYWWLQMIPLALCKRMQDGRVWKALFIWILCQLHWLFWAYLLEFRQLPVVYAVWAASWIFLAANIYLLTVL